LSIINKICRENSSLVTVRQMSGTSREDLHKFHGNIWLKYSRNKKVSINFVAQITSHSMWTIFFRKS